MTTEPDFYNKENSSQKGGESEIRSRMFEEWIGTGRKVLDTGCGDGASGEKWVRNNNSVYGIDLAFVPAKQATRCGIDVVVSNIAEGLPFCNSCFDVVVAGEIIEHLYDTDAFLKECRRVLRDSGLLLLSTPNLASFARRLMLLAGKNPFCEFSLEENVSGVKPVGHIRYFTQKNLINLLSKHGFSTQIITSDGMNLGIFNSIYLARLFPSFGWRHIVKAQKL